MSGRSLSSTTILSFLALLNMESRVFRLYHTSAQTCNFRIDSYAYCTHTYPKPDSVRYSLAYSHNSYSIPSYSSRTLHAFKKRGSQSDLHFPITLVLDFLKCRV